MKRFARYLLTLGSAASLLLFVASCVSLACSPWGADRGRRGVTVGGGTYFIVSRGGGLDLVRQRLASGSGPANVKPHVDRLGQFVLEVDGRDAFKIPHDVASGNPKLLGFAHQRIVRSRMFAGGGFFLDYQCYTVPYWFALTATAALPAAWLPGIVRRHRRRRDGCCLACGYDLRATHDRCPECGSIPEASPRTAA